MRRTRNVKIVAAAGPASANYDVINTLSKQARMMRFGCT